MRLILTFCLLAQLGFAAEPEFPLTADSKPQPGIPQGMMIKDSYTAMEGSVFPGTQREYQIYLPADHDKAKPAAFMVFQDGVIYQAPVVFDNLIAKKDIPPLVGLFIKPGVVPAANDNALPRFNRSYEYDSITSTYSQFLIEEFLPAIEAKHGLKLSTDPNHAAISGNSSGGICAFMTAWHRPDRFRRVFTGVGTYVGIHGADQLPVLVRKFEPKPLRIFLQSGTGDNNLYCGDWWMANQMMERSLTWAGYDVNHAWGEGGHNQNHASQIFPDVLRWLWRDWQTNIEVKANPKGESKWKGYEVVGDGEWLKVPLTEPLSEGLQLEADSTGKVLLLELAPQESPFGPVDAEAETRFSSITPEGSFQSGEFSGRIGAVAFTQFGPQTLSMDDVNQFKPQKLDSIKDDLLLVQGRYATDVAVTETGHTFILANGMLTRQPLVEPSDEMKGDFEQGMSCITLSPDQSLLYAGHSTLNLIWSIKLGQNGLLSEKQPFHLVEGDLRGIGGVSDLCVDQSGWLYVATEKGIQVCDQAGRVNFIIPTPKPASDLCFGGKDLSELFIACGDSIYKRPTKAKGVVSGQQAPIKPAPPKL